MSGSKNILWIGAALLVAGCTVKDPLSDTLSGEGKTPLLIEAIISTDFAETKAVDKEFTNGDVLLAYLRHTTSGPKGSYTTISAHRAPHLVTLTKGSTAMVEVDVHTQKTQDLTTIYWDDFSNSSSPDTDLRTTGHGLQSFYGYCYNGGTPTTPLNEVTGGLGWTVQEDQSTVSNFQHSDLLWSLEQETVPYDHNNNVPFSIPYTHAMSKITVKVTASDGFSGNPLTNTVLTLHDMNTVATLTAPTGQCVAVYGDANVNIKDIIMYGGSYTTGLTRTYTAIVTPGTKLKIDADFLDITNADGNNYKLKITDQMVANGAHWAVGHVYDNVDKSVLTQPGYNYQLNLTIKKAKVLVNATITDWTSVDAEGEGDIIFSHDDDPEHLVMDDSENPGTPGSVHVVAVDENKFQDNSTFTLFWCEAASAEAAADPNKVNSNYRFASITSFHDVDNSGNPKAYDYWTNNPTIFWPNNSKNYYFRALAKYKGVVSEHEVLQSVGKYNSAYLTDNDTYVSADFHEVTGVSQGSINDGHDILWGTTALHYGTTSPQKTYQRSQAIPPRTGGVPIAFEHAMSKITFNALHTGSGSAESANDPAVDLTGATIALAQLYITGTISIETGTITLGSLTADAVSASTTPPSNLVVIPQTFTDDAQVVVTLNNGTIYRLPLKQCVVSGGSTPITAWERGKSYTYNINVKKEGVQFHVQVKDWEEVTGSGDAIIDWSNE